MPAPLFRDRPRHVQIILGGVVPFLIGAAAGILIGVSTGWYWAVAALAGVGGVLAGLEHRDGWGGADRGLVGGSLFALGLLISHAIAGTEAKVSLGSFPPFLIVIDAIVGICLGAIGGRIARATRHRAATSEAASARTATHAAAPSVAETAVEVGAEPVGGAVGGGEPVS
jgi:hypothetical protein